VKVHEVIELPFGVMSRVSRGMGALVGGPHLAMRRAGLGGFLPHRFEWHFRVYF